MTKNAPDEPTKLFQKRNGETVEVNASGGRPARTYRANKHWLDAKSNAPARHEFDRATYRSLRRQGARARAGRWPGIGDPNAMESWRKQQAAQKPKRSRKKVESA